MYSWLACPATPRKLSPSKHAEAQARISVGRKSGGVVVLGLQGRFDPHLVVFASVVEPQPWLRTAVLNDSGNGYAVGVTEDRSIGQHQIFAATDQLSSAGLRLF